MTKLRSNAETIRRGITGQAHLDYQRSTGLLPFRFAMRNPEGLPVTWVRYYGDLAAAQAAAPALAQQTGHVVLDVQPGAP